MSHLAVVGRVVCDVCGDAEIGRVERTARWVQVVLRWYDPAHDPTWHRSFRWLLTGAPAPPDHPMLRCNHHEPMTFDAAKDLARLRAAARGRPVTIRAYPVAPM